MKQKTLKFTLIIGTLFIWGAISFKVFAILSKKDAQPVSETNQNDQPIVIDKKETFPLLLNYKDPFSNPGSDTTLSTVDTGDTSTSKIKPKNSSLSPITPMPEKQDVSFIKYLGMISNPKRRSKIAIMSVKGQGTVMQEGTEVDGIKLYAISISNVSIHYHGKRYRIERY